jgi:uncharacterized protein YdiU (UPF0061 family)
MDYFDPKACFSSIDRQGRYAWPNQPGIMHWNLAVLAQCLLPLINDDAETAEQIAQDTVDRYPKRFHAHHQRWLAAKLGLDNIAESDAALVQSFHDIMAAETLDFTLAFRWLTEIANHSLEHTPLPELFRAPPALVNWVDDWQARRKSNKGDTSAIAAAMYSVNPTIIPRNHLVQKAIDLSERGNLSWVKAMATRSQYPFEWQTEDVEWAKPPEPEERITRTFCGT